jgi:glycosyltransferase involved in cell wall biosynthesis
MPAGRASDADPLRIAIIAPPWLPVPPGSYGGIEAFAAELADALRAHYVAEIRMYASGDSPVSDLQRIDLRSGPVQRALNQTHDGVFRDVLGDAPLAFQRFVVDDLVADPVDGIINMYAATPLCDMLAAAGLASRTIVSVQSPLPQGRLRFLLDRYYYVTGVSEAHTKAIGPLRRLLAVNEGIDVRRGERRLEINRRLETELLQRSPLDMTTDQILDLLPRFGEFAKIALWTRTFLARFLLLTAHVTPPKGQLTAVEILHRVRNDKRARRLDVKLVLAGDANTDDNRRYLERVRSAITARGLTEHVAILGNVTPQQRDLLLQLAWVVLAPHSIEDTTWLEAYGRTLVEAAVAGRPVVASRRGSLPEVVRHGVSGLLFDPRNLDEAVDAVFASRHLDGQPIRRHAQVAHDVRATAKRYYTLLRAMKQGRQLPFAAVPPFQDEFLEPSPPLLHRSDDGKGPALSIGLHLDTGVSNSAAAPPDRGTVS